MSSAIGSGHYQPRGAGFPGLAGCADCEAPAARVAARSRAAGSRPSAAWTALQSSAPATTAQARVRRSSQPSSGSALRTAKSTSRLDEEHPERRGQREGVVDPARPGDDDARDGRRTPSRSRRPTSTPTALDQPPSRPATGAATAAAAPVTSAPTRRNEMSQGACGRGRRSRDHLPVGRLPRGAGRRSGRGLARARSARAVGCSARLRSRWAASSAARASRAARRARGLSTTTTPTTSSTRDRDEQLRPAAGDRQRDGAEGQQGRPEVHDEDGAAVRVPDRQQPVVQVHLVRRERRLALAGAPDDGQHAGR